MCLEGLLFYSTVVTASVHYTSHLPRGEDIDQYTNNGVCASSETGIRAPMFSYLYSFP